MPDSIKEQERAELHRTIWNIANDLRGSVDGWDFKQYVLGRDALLPLHIRTWRASAPGRGSGDASLDYARLMTM